MFNLGNFNPIVFIGILLGFVIGTTFHEFMHAFTALQLGDPTAQRMGRVTLNPAAHFDPFGFFMGIMLALGVPALAWGRPVPVNPYGLRFGRRGWALVSFAGPFSNLVFAAALLPIVKFGGSLVSTDVKQVVLMMIYVNILLFTFNLVPIPPLDGYNILGGILPNAWIPIIEPLRQYALPILLGLIFFVPFVGSMLHINLNVLSAILGPVQQVITRVFVGV